MTEPTEQRIEDAQRAIADAAKAFLKTSSIVGLTYSQRKAIARAALTADAPFAASEYERGMAAGLEEAITAVRAAHITTRYDAVIAENAINARLSALKDGGAPKLDPDAISSRRFGESHEKPCKRPTVLTCALWECQHANECQHGKRGP